jgi:hypothetical protein
MGSRICEEVDERGCEWWQDDESDAWTTTHGAYPEFAWNFHIRCPEET